MLVVVVLATWFVLALGAALILGGGIRMADRRAPFTDHLAGLPAELTVDDILGARTTQPSH
jgi:hypothetical protein